MTVDLNITVLLFMHIFKTYILGTERSLFLPCGLSLCVMDVDGVAQQAGVDWAPDLIVSREGLCKQQEARAQVNQHETLLFIYVEALHKHTTNAMCASIPLHPIHTKPFYPHLQKVSASIDKDMLVYVISKDNGLS